MQSTGSTGDAPKIGDTPKIPEDTKKKKHSLEGVPTKSLEGVAGTYSRTDQPELKAQREAASSEKTASVAQLTPLQQMKKNILDSRVRVPTDSIDDINKNLIQITEEYTTLSKKFKTFEADIDKMKQKGEISEKNYKALKSVIESYRSGLIDAVETTIGKFYHFDFISPEKGDITSSQKKIIDSWVLRIKRGGVDLITQRLKGISKAQPGLERFMEAMQKEGIIDQDKVNETREYVKNMQQVIAYFEERSNSPEMEVLGAIAKTAKAFTEKEELEKIEKNIQQRYMANIARETSLPGVDDKQLRKISTNLEKYEYEARLLTNVGVISEETCRAICEEISRKRKELEKFRGQA